MGADVALFWAGVYGLAGLLLLGYGYIRKEAPQAWTVGLLTLALTLKLVLGSPSLGLAGHLTAATRMVLGFSVCLFVEGLVLWVLWTCFPAGFQALKIGSWHLKMVGARQEGGPPRWGWINTGVSLGLFVFSAGLLLGTWLLPASVLPSLALLFQGSRGLVLLLAASVVLASWHTPAVRTLRWGALLCLPGGVYDVLVGWQVPGDGMLVTPYTWLGFLGVFLYGLLLRKPDAKTGQPGVRPEWQRAHGIALQVSRLSEGQFLGTVSHEMRTPLAAILGYTQLLEAELKGQITRHQEEFLQTIQLSAERMMVLINDLLDLARLEGGHLQLDLHAVALPVLVREVVHQLYPLRVEKNLSLTLDLDEPMPPAWADPARLRQVLINLVSNAIKFTSQGGITIRVFTTGPPEQPLVGCAVQDTGAGITPEFLPRLFERFAQERRYGGAYAGTGLGLTISKELVQRMGGQIQVESQVGVGSTFTLLMPVAPNAGSD